MSSLVKLTLNIFPDRAAILVWVSLCMFLLSFISYAQRARPKPTSKPQVPSQSQSQSQAQTYTFDASQSQINAILDQQGLIVRRHPNHTVAAKSFSGKINLPKDEAHLAVTLEAQTDALTNIDSTMGDFERKEFHAALRNEVLETGKFPTIQFRSVSVANIQRSGDNRTFTLTGDLTLHGVTRRVVFPVKATITKDQLQATGEAKLKQSDFGMKPFEKGLGLIKIGDEVKVTFTVVAKAQ
jgi:polyisoprenoid-binding protein YceI